MFAQDHMKKTLIALFAIVCSSALWAQQDVQFTQFANNKIFYNPGVTGAGDAILIPVVFVTGVVISTSWVRTSRVAS